MKQRHHASPIDGKLPALHGAITRTSSSHPDLSTLLYAMLNCSCSSGQEYQKAVVEEITRRRAGLRARLGLLETATHPDLLTFDKTAEEIQNAIAQVFAPAA